MKRVKAVLLRNNPLVTVFHERQWACSAGVFFFLLEVTECSVAQTVLDALRLRNSLLEHSVTVLIEKTAESALSTKSDSASGEVFTKRVRER